MALVYPFLLKTVLGTDKPELKADPGEAFLVKDIKVSNPVSNYITVKIEKTTVGYFRVGGPLGGHQNFRLGRAQHSHTVRVGPSSTTPPDNWAPLQDPAANNRKLILGSTESVGSGAHLDEDRVLLWSGYHLGDTLLSFLGKAGIFKGFPVAEGETLTIEGMGGANSITLIEYEQYEPGDISPEQENGPRSKEYLMVNYGNTGAAISGPGDHLYDTSANPAEFPDFPFGTVVPAKHEVEVLGILGSPFAPKGNDGTNYIYTKFLKLLKDREVLFDEDRNGILFWSRHTSAVGKQDMIAEGFTLIGNLSEYDNNPPLMFPAPLKFAAGDEFNVYVTTEAGGSPPSIGIQEQEIALIQKVRRVE